MKKIYTAMLASLLFAACTKDDEAVKISSISVLPETATVFVGEALPELALSVTPEKALEGKTVAWTSSNPEIIAVSEDGTLSFVVDDIEEAEKAVTITATVEDKSATSVITVKGEIAKYEIVEAAGLLILDRNVGATEAYDATLTGDAAEANIKASTGNYYQWGKNTVVATGADETVNSEFVNDWNWDINDTEATGWTVAENTPCPKGWTVPSLDQLKAIIAELNVGIDGAENEELLDALKIAPTGYFKTDFNADKTEVVVVKKNPGNGYWYGATLTAGTSSPASWAVPGIQAVCVLENGSFPNAPAKSICVNWALPVRCVKAVSAE